MKTVLIDTSALLHAVRNKLDLFTELPKAYNFPFRVAVVAGTIEELRRSAVRGKEKRTALLALALLQAKKIPLIHEKGNVDDLLAEHSRKGALVITQDVELKKRLTKPYLTIRQRKKIMVVQ